jgi:hypothetical protein
MNAIDYITIKFFDSETAWPNEPNLVGSIYGRLIYKDCSFSPDPLTNMAATGSSWCWLADMGSS